MKKRCPCKPPLEICRRILCVGMTLCFLGLPPLPFSFADNSQKLTDQSIDGIPIPPPLIYSQITDPQQSIYDEKPFYKSGSIFIRGPRELPETPAREVLPLEQLLIRLPPDFYIQSQLQPLPQPLRTFLEDTLIPGESAYFQPGIGTDVKTGMPYDHIRIRLEENLLSEVGNYTAASKLSLMIPYLMKVVQRDRQFRKAPTTPKAAAEQLEKTLQTILTYIKDYPEYEGFLPWVDIRPNGTIAPASKKVPSLDNGQLTWALAAVVAAFERSSDKSRKRLAGMAQSILDAQNYRQFYDPKKGLLHGTIQYDPETKTWHGDQTYYLDDMFEGTMAVLWGVLHGQIPQEAWDNLTIPTVEYTTEAGEKITTLEGFRASFHEHWGLAYLPIMESRLAPLYQNYLYAQADYARRQNLPGFLSTAYDSKGVYRQMGVPEISRNPVDRSDTSVLFATAMAMLISPTVGATWIEQFYDFKNLLVGSYGAVESVGHEGLADVFTADAKGMTLLAVGGGVIKEVKKYLKEHKVPGTDLTMESKLQTLLESKYNQMLAARDNRPLLFPTKPFPKPPEKTIQVRFQKPPDAGAVFDVSAHLQPGHLHGRNVRSVGLKTLEQDIFPGEPIQFEFDIPAYYEYFEQYAFRGTYIDQAVRIADMRYASVTIPADLPPTMCEIQFKSDDIALTTFTVKSTARGVLSKDGKWKTLVEKITPVPDADIKPFNYISIAIHDPRYLMGVFAPKGRKGKIVLKDIRLTKEFPLKNIPEPLYKEFVDDKDEFELIRYWRLTHGDLAFKNDPAKGSYTFVGGLGWRGGYIPYTNLAKFHFLYLKARSVSNGCNCFYLELKHESDELLGSKIPLHMPEGRDWRIFEVPIPQNIRPSFNYIAISDPHSGLEIGSMLLASTEITGIQKDVIPFPFQAPEPLECTHRPCPKVLPDDKH